MSMRLEQRLDDLSSGSKDADRSVLTRNARRSQITHLLRFPLAYYTKSVAFGYSKRDEIRCLFVPPGRNATTVRFFLRDSSISIAIHVVWSTVNQIQLKWLSNMYIEFYIFSPPPILFASMYHYVISYWFPCLYSSSKYWRSCQMCFLIPVNLLINCMLSALYPACLH